MEKVQELAIQEIYCAPHEDKQFRFKFVRVTQPGSPIRTTVKLFDFMRLPLPDITSKFHVYLIGRTPATLLNLKADRCVCQRTGWTNVAEDMNNRKYIFQVYDDLGLNYPRELIYYRLTDTGALVFAIKEDDNLKGLFDIDDFKYMRVYSNYYYDTRPNQGQVVIKGKLIGSKTDIVTLSREFTALKKDKGNVFYYVNGYFSETINTNLPMGCYIEAFYDKMLGEFERFKPEELRTYMSPLSNRLKYILHRDRNSQFLQYKDDLEVYISCKNKDQKGVYFYQNLDISFSNITDKDFGIDSAYVLDQSRSITKIQKRPVDSAEIILITRKTEFERSLIFNALKLHELYKLPTNIEYDVISNHNMSIDDYRVEHLEDSPYFKVASAEDIAIITKELATEAVGYNGCAWYFGNTPMKVTNETHVRAPYLYRGNSTAYEYDKYGQMIGFYPHYDSMYAMQNKETTDVEFIQGVDTVYNKIRYQGESEDIDVEREYLVIGTSYKDGVLGEVWEDITKDMVIVDGKIKHPDAYRIAWRLMYRDSLSIVDRTYDLEYGLTVIGVEVREIMSDGLIGLAKPSFAFDTVEVFLNGNRLQQGLDFFMDYPTIQICNKTYLSYKAEEDGTMPQRVHIRCSGIQLDKERVNHREMNGFINHGVMCRSKPYEIRDDRVFSCFVKGKLYPRDKIRWAYEDNTVRMDDPFNGFPYTIADHVISIKAATGLDTHEWYLKDHMLNKRVANLYSKIYPTPEIYTTNLIKDHHYVYSPLITRLILDMESGALPSDVYTRNYQEGVVEDLLHTTYWDEARLDPLTKEFPHNLVIIHPTPWLYMITLSVDQYRFLHNVIHHVTGGKTNRIELSGYFFIDQSRPPIDYDKVYEVGVL